MADGPTLAGELHEVPFGAGGTDEVVAEAYGELVAEFGVDDVLVLKRFSTETDAVAETLGTAVSGIERPDVVGLTANANTVVEALDVPPRRLEAGERSLLIQFFLRGRDWETPYLDRASEKDSFPFNAGRFITEATWQGSDIDTDDPVLAELAAAMRAYHDWIESGDIIDSARTYRFAADALADDRLRQRVQTGFDAVLVLEFEEFTAIDREYLARLTDDCPLVCVAERNCAIQRTWNEPGRITDHTPALTVTRHDYETQTSRPQAIATFLATGTAPSTPVSGSAAVIEAPTFRGQIATIAAEIGRLYRAEAVPYEEMAVVLRDANAPIAETLRYLRRDGVPVASATVSGLEHHPAARELYALASWCLNSGTTNEAGDPDLGWSESRARAVLDARVEGLEAAYLERIRAIGRENTPAAALDRWLLDTELKHRVATDDDTLTVRTQFDHVRTVLDLVAAIDRSAMLEADWATVCEGLELEMQRATTDKVATDLEVPEGGVLVDAVRVVKNLDREAVFLVDVIDREYPATPAFNPLFPTAHLEQLPEYPSFSTPTPDDIHATFSVADATASDPFRAYYAALSRRLLAVGARAAGDRLYFGVRREADGTGQRLRPSRYLDAVEEAVGSLERVEHDEIHTHGEAVRLALDGVDDAFEAVRRGGLVDDPVDIAGVEADLATIQAVLESDPPADLADAIGARVDFADGVVRRE